MSLDVIALDHLYLTVRDFAASQAFYDRVMETLGFKKGDLAVAGEPHAHYFNRQLQISIRPARAGTAAHDRYAPGLHHVCLQMPDRAAVDEAAAALRGLGIEVEAPASYPQYAPDYYSLFFHDPDGIRLELVAKRALRREVVEKWERLTDFLNPLQRLREREEDA